MNFTAAKGAVYYDCPFSIAEEFTQALVPSAISVFASLALKPAWGQDEFDRRRIYVRDMHDRIITPKKQDWFVAQSEKKWMVKEIESRHCAWASKPEEFVGIMKQCVEALAN